jgi:hypothetical protein
MILAACRGMIGVLTWLIYFPRNSWERFLKIGGASGAMEWRESATL